MSAKKIKQERKIQSLSAAKLKRARRLYVKLCEKSIHKSPEMIFIYAQRAQMNGLYSSKTGFRDVIWHFVRRLWRIDSERGKYRIFDDFSRDSGLWGLWNKKKCWHFYSKHRKPRIRVVA